MNELFQGWSEKDAKKIKVTLSNLLTYIPTREFTFVGSLPIRYFYQRLGISYKKRDINDLDTALTSLRKIDPAFTDKFLVYHIHTYPKYKQMDFSFKFFLALIDKETSIKIDIFSEYPYTFCERIKYDLDGTDIYLPSSEDQLITQVLEAERIMLDGGHRLDYKRRDAIRNLQKTSNMKLAENYWKERDLKLEQRTLQDVIDNIESHLSKNGRSALKYLKKKKAKRCKACIQSKKFPIASIDELNKHLLQS